MAQRTGSTRRKPTKTRSQPPKTAKRSPARTRPASLGQELEKAAAGLYNVSESDRPFRFFTLPGNETELTAQGLLNCIGLSQAFIDEFNLPIERVIEERKLEGFFPSLEDIAAYEGAPTTDPKVVAESKRFRKLEAVLRKRLGDVRVFRIGMVEVQCFIAGIDKNKNVAGLLTTAIET